MIPLSSVKMFVSILEKGDDVHKLNLIDHGNDIPNKFLKDTKWHNSTKPTLVRFCQIFF